MAHNGGKVQVNVSDAQPHTGRIWLNVLKQGVSQWGADSWTEEYPLLLNSKRYPTRMPVNVGSKWYLSQVWIYGRPDDVWVLDWQGATGSSLDITLEYYGGEGGVNLTASGSTFKEYTMWGTARGPNNTIQWFDAGNHTWYSAMLCRLRIDSMTANMFDAAGKGIRLYRKEYQTLINSGEIWDPQFLIKNNFGKLRFANWMLGAWGSTVSNHAHWGYNKDPDACSYCALDYIPERWAGLATLTNNNYVVAQPSTPIAAMNDMEQVQFHCSTYPSFRAPVSITNANPAVVNDPGHGLTTGDKIEFSGQVNSGNWGALAHGTIGIYGTAGNNWLTLQVTVVDADHFSINGVDSTTWGAYPGRDSVNDWEWWQYYKQITIKVGSLAAKPVTMQRYASNFWWVQFRDMIEYNGGQTTATFDAVLDRWLMMPDTAALLQNGVPFQRIVEVCNRIGAHPYLGLPVFATDDYVSNMYTYLHDNLDTGLRSEMEIANEIWGWHYTWYYAARAAYDPELGNAWNYNLWYGKRMSQIADIANPIFSGSGKQYALSFAIQSGYIGVSAFTDRMTCPPLSGATPGASSGAAGGNPALYPINKAQAVIAGAPYIAPPFLFSSGALGTCADWPGYGNALAAWKTGDKDTYFNFMRDAHITDSSVGGDPHEQVNGQLGTYLPQWVTLAASFSAPGHIVNFVGYEGGPATPGPNYLQSGFPAVFSGQTITFDDICQAWFDFLDSTQMGEVIKAMCEGSEALGVKFPAQYQITSIKSINNIWGLDYYNDFLETGHTPAWTALKSFNDGKGPGWLTRK